MTDTRETRCPDKNHLTCNFFVGLGRFELPTFGPPDHRNLSKVFIQTPSARGIRPRCSSGKPVSVWWHAFCAMRCAPRKATAELANL